MSEANEVIRREFPVELETTGDGRTLDIRIVPYNTPTRVADPPDFIPYEEEWEPGAFDKQLDAANRVSVFVNVEHEQGIKGIVGRGTGLRDDPADGLHGTFRMLDHPDADKALQLVNEGDLTGVSLEFVPQKSVRENGVMKRVKARLVNIALCRPSGSAGGIQAYQGAGVLAVREAPEGESQPEPTEAPGAPDDQKIIEEPGVPDPPPPKERLAVDEVLERIGYEPLISRAISKKPWDGSPARFSDEEYERSCLIDRRGDAPPKERCSLPVLEPNGDINEIALWLAAKRINQVTGVSTDLKGKAARKLIRYYNQAGSPPPALLRAMAAK